MRTYGALLITVVCAFGADHFNAGMAAYHARDYDRAVPELEAYLKTAPPDQGTRKEAVAALGLTYHMLRNYAKAIPLLEEVSTGDQANTEFAWALGISHVRTRNPNGARIAFARLFHVPPESAAARVLNARFLMREQMENLAQAELEKARDLDSRTPQLHHLLGELALSRNEPQAAIGEFQLELAANPASWMTHYLLGQAYTRLENLRPAIGPLQKAIWLNPDFSSPYVLLGSVYLRTEDYPSAEGMLKRAISMDPNNANARFQLGTVYQKTGRSKEAAAQFELYRALKK
jgi:tetratricopeptide (TPR) repeat protein